VKRLSYLLVVVVLSACVAGPRGDAPIAWVDRSEAILNLSTWSLNGRIGLQTADHGFNGSLSWQQTNDDMRADFHGPLGAGAFRVSGNPDELVLETGDGAVYALDEPEASLENALGWGVPLHALRYWLIGVPHPDIPSQTSFDPDGRLATIEQLEWRVVYERYSVAEGWEMPRKLVLDNSGDVRIKLVISRWSITPAAES